MHAAFPAEEFEQMDIRERIRSAVAQERERCAKIADSYYGREFCNDDTADKIAAEIRKCE